MKQKMNFVFEIGWILVSDLTFIIYFISYQINWFSRQSEVVDLILLFCLFSINDEVENVHCFLMNFSVELLVWKHELDEWKVVF